MAAAGDVHSIMLCMADGEPEVPICINLDAFRNEFEVHATITDAASGVPQSTKEALEGEFKEEWQAAYTLEYEAKVANGTFTLVKRPRNRKVVGTKIAHAHKVDDTGVIKERKARWVAKGFTQIFGKDFTSTFTATAYAAAVRAFLVLVCLLDLDVAKCDVTKAFTLADLDVELYCEQFPGRETVGPGCESIHDTVCLLHKALEGLKQAGFLWQQKHTAFILSYIFEGVKAKQSDIDPCVFELHCSCGILLLLVWVDDMLIAYKGSKLFEHFKRAYGEAFPARMEGGFDKEPGVFVGLTIARDRKQKRMAIHQKPLIERAYEKFIGTKPVASRAPTSDRKSERHYSKLETAKDDAERNAMKLNPYLAILATLMYRAVFTGPHIAFHCCFLGQFMHDPSLIAYAAVLELLAWEYDNRDVTVITFGGPISMPQSLPKNELERFVANGGLYGSSDASWLLRSIGGYIVMFGNGPLDWGARVIRVICHSSAEAETGAASMMSKRLSFLLQLLNDMGYKLEVPIIVFIDNTAALEICQKLGASAKTAHFLRWLFYFRACVLSRMLKPYFCPTKQMLADPMTKAVDAATLLKFFEIVFNKKHKFI